MATNPLQSLPAPALVFAGQASRWQESLIEAASNPDVALELTTLLAAARERTAPVGREIAIAAPGAGERLDELLAGGEPPASRPGDVRPAVSVPGIVLGQIAAHRELRELGLELGGSTPLVGYSQGSLGALAADEPLEALSLAIVLGAALSAKTAGGTDRRPRMLAVGGATREFIDAHRGDAALAVANGRLQATLSGSPEQLAEAQSRLEAAAKEHNDALEERRIGGSAIELAIDPLPVAGAFHHPDSAAAAELTREWFAAAGFDAAARASLIEEILVEPEDWPAKVRSLIESGARDLVVLDRSLAKLTDPLVAGTGARVIDASTADERDRLATPGQGLPEAETWERFAPRVATLPSGRRVLHTKFSETTGLSPIMLAGMTPTTVDADIVAAAANAGHWTELAGGGQYSEEVFNRNKDSLLRQLEPGRAAQFNSMYFDRHLWALQFGQQRIVSKARAAGAPINGVTVSAGVPEPEEAEELVTQLQDDGYTYISFKPGTVEQIRATLDIADHHPGLPIVMQVEDGHAGGHHSWVDLDEMLLATYPEIRRRGNVSLTVGGGLGVPEVAARYLTGEWAADYGLPAMPVDGVLVGTAAMTTKEAKTSPQVKELLKNTPGIPRSHNDGWVARLGADGGVASSQSHLLADLHEADNAFSRVSQYLTAMDPAEFVDHKDEIVEMLAGTAKPYFGDVDEMTYAEWIRHFVELAYPWQDPTWTDRFLDLVHRIEARLAPEGHGEIETLFPTEESILDGPAVVEKLTAAYPEAETTRVLARDAAWWVGLNLKHHKPMPWVTAIDQDLERWFGLDVLWQSQDERYPADAVRVIPGPVSVAGIDRVDEPVADLLARYESHALERLDDPEELRLVSRLDSATSLEELAVAAPTILWHGRLIPNPAHELPRDAFDLVERGEGRIDVVVNADSAWDNLPKEQRPYHVERVSIPLILGPATETGASPVVDPERLVGAVYELLAGVAGVGSTSQSEREITALPEAAPEAGSPFGVVRDRVRIPAALLAKHTTVSGAAITDNASGVPDVLVGPLWPAIYATLGTGRIAGDYPVIEGLLNAVHFDHTVSLERPLAEIADGRKLDVEGRCIGIDESSSGRIVTLTLTLSDNGETVANLTERFAIRGRAEGEALPDPAAPFGGGRLADEIAETPRSFVDRRTVTAPGDMTPFAIVSGDYNPIHTSTNAAGLVGLDAPLVHGMWLSATAQHLAAESGRVIGWTYEMYGMVQLGDEVEITVERTGRAGLNAALEVTCRIDDVVVSRGRGIVAEPKVAYVYPGQGIQETGMGEADRAASPAARDAWRRAEEHTRTKLGFSIRRVVDENPTELDVRGRVFKHPDGVLNLTQFTQVALAVVAYAQTERLREEGAVASGAMYAGHSLGEYTALASMGGIFGLEDIIDVVYSRGTAMDSLVPRDEAGNTNYGLGALRPNMIGVSAAEVQGFVASVAEDTGEFLEIVNLNIPGQQYSVAGTKAGLDALEAKANAANPRAFVRLSGIDVPFHSRVLRPGVADFAAKLDELLPERLDLDALVGRYVPNLVARPFELTDEFLDAIRETVPTERLAGVNAADYEPHRLARLLMIELLSWQFASPVRWIETQELLIGSVEELVEVGLENSPTLTSMAGRTLKVLGKSLPVYNAQRDHEAVTLSDQRSAPTPEVTEAPAEEGAPQGRDGSGSPAETEPAPAQPEPAAEAAPARATQAPQGGGSNAGAPELPFDAAAGIDALIALQNKIRVDQISGTDTVEDLTNGVSSRRNQLLMDMSAELGVSAIDGASDADMATLSQTVRGAAPTYKPFGPVLGEAVSGRLRTLTAAAGKKPARVAERVTADLGLPESWVGHVEAELVLGTREGESVRGGELGGIAPSVSSAAELDEIIDQAVERVAQANGTQVSLNLGGAGAGAGGEVVDSAALNELAEKVTGDNGVLAGLARETLARLGLDQTPEPEEGDDAAAELARTIEAELGSDWPGLVEPAFDARRAVLFDDRWAGAREDLARLALLGGEAAGLAGEEAQSTGRHALSEEPAVVARFRGTGERLAGQASWWAEHPAPATDPELLARIATAAAEPAEEPLAADVALVTGAAPGSIAAEVTARLLSQGATVIITASKVTTKRKEFARRLYARHASPSAKLWLAPANLSSYRDVDALVDWVATEQTETAGATTKVVKPALVPTLLFPFAAPPVAGSLADAGAPAENQTRLLLWSVERLIGALSEVARGAIDTRCHVVLPASPNRGIFGGDGAYGEVKAALDAIVNKWSAEAGWPEGVTLAQATIGWVAGTNLMGGNDALVPEAQRAGIHVWDPEEISHELVALASEETREKARTAPVAADLSGGLGGSEISLPALARRAQERAAEEQAGEPDAAQSAPRIKALPSIAAAAQPKPVDVGEVTTDLDDMIVVVGLGEVSTWGSGRTRSEAEYGIGRDGSVDLTPAGVLELAWMTGLVHWSEDPTPGWYDADGEPVAEEDIYERFRDEVVARSGIRPLSDKFRLTDGASIDEVEVFLDHDVTVPVPSQEVAEDVKAADPERTRISVSEDGEWSITRLAGATVRVPRRATLSRSVAGQMPDDFDPARWGIPASLIDGADRMAIWNLVTAVDAFVGAGFSPIELLQAVHPGDVASTQGTGIGGMESLHKVFVTRFLGEERPSDILQEALPNIVAAHTMQSYVGGYGSMIHPVGACATAAVSVEEGVDKIALNKADLVVAGGIDDVSVESLTGFGDMNATAETAAMRAKGIDDRFISRANDRRRGGFLEAEGGGTILLARGSLAARLGLPVYAVVAHAASYADGAHTSIPAPGLGALGAARGGRDSKLARSLGRLGLTPDDVRVVSKHDTSTNANDPNEAELHATLWGALGRSAENPLFVISQKSLTGHAKGGAAIFQLGGLVEVLRSGRLPQNASLDCVDPALEDLAGPAVWLKAPLDLGAGAVKAAALTSLGFGHVAALVVLAHPGVFERALANTGGDPEAWRRRATERLQAGAKHLEQGMIGRRPLFEPIEGRRLPAAGGRDAEIALLLDKEGRLGGDGFYPAP
mgnify:CR=1 FL=1